MASSALALAHTATYTRASFANCLKNCLKDCLEDCLAKDIYELHACFIMKYYEIGSMAKGTYFGRIQQPNTHAKDAYLR